MRCSSVPAGREEESAVAGRKEERRLASRYRLAGRRRICASHRSVAEEAAAAVVRQPDPARVDRVGSEEVEAAGPGRNSPKVRQNRRREGFCLWSLVIWSFSPVDNASRVPIVKPNPVNEKTKLRWLNSGGSGGNQPVRGESALAVPIVPATTFARGPILFVIQSGFKQLLESRVVAAKTLPGMRRSSALARRATTQ